MYLYKKRQRFWMERLGEVYDFVGVSYGRCIYHTLAGLWAARECGIEAIVQGGECVWRFDDAPIGDAPDGFGYGWDPYSDISREAHMAGKLMEVHAWVYLLDKGVIVDFGAGTIPDGCPFEWKMPRPPEVLEARPEELRSLQCSYVAHVDATLYVMSVLRMVCKDLERKGLGRYFHEFPIYEGFPEWTLGMSFALLRQLRSDGVTGDNLER